MKFLIISLIILLSFSVSFVGVVQGQNIDKYPSLVEISLQIQLRDSDGLLVAYYEPTRIWILDIALVHEYLDTKENKSIISKDGRNFEVITWEQSKSYRGDELETAFGFSIDGDLAVIAYSDGYLTEPGDTSSKFWKVVRPVS